MKKFPDNGWSLSGLQASLERQGKRADAAAVRGAPRPGVGRRRYGPGGGAPARRSCRSGVALAR